VVACSGAQRLKSYWYECAAYSVVVIFAASMSVSITRMCVLTEVEDDLHADSNHDSTCVE
jgi:hypothetical protein